MKMPQAWGKVLASSIESEESPNPAPVNATSTAPTGTRVEASLDMSAETIGEGLCPECKKPMEKVMLNGNEVYVCMADRITLPIKDEENPSEPAA